MIKQLLVFVAAVSPRWQVYFEKHISRIYWAASHWGGSSSPCPSSLTNSFILRSDASRLLKFKPDFTTSQFTVSPFPREDPLSPVIGRIVYVENELIGCCLNPHAGCFATWSQCSSTVMRPWWLVIVWISCNYRESEGFLFGGNLSGCYRIIISDNEHRQRCFSPEGFGPVLRFALWPRDLQWDDRT